MRIGMLALVILLLVPAVLAHAEQESTAKYYIDTSLSVIIYSFIALSILVVVAILLKDSPSQSIKRTLFISMTVIIVAATIYSAGATIYINIQSDTKGPVHWHADFEIWNCAQKLDLLNPSGMSNRIGTPVFHEHGDDRIHVEGVVSDLEDVTLHEFFKALGGDLSADQLTVSLNAGMRIINNGDTCDNTPAVLQVFVYTINEAENVYKQTKLSQFEDYVLSPHSNIPPGDCIIVEFGPEKESTEHICSSYSLAIQKGELRGS